MESNREEETLPGWAVGGRMSGQVIEEEVRREEKSRYCLQSSEVSRLALLMPAAVLVTIGPQRDSLLEQITWGRTADFCCVGRSDSARLHYFSRLCCYHGLSLMKTTHVLDSYVAQSKHQI